jgi:release factor glutamine methyltransferase
MNIAQALHDLTARFREAGIASPRLDAEVLVSHIMDLDRHRLITDAAAGLTESECSELEAMARRRIEGEPVAYLVGEKEFYSLPFHVTRAVLIPRPETELLVDMAIYQAPRGARVLDLCTGSGAIAVALKHARRDCEVFASDISPDALAVAEDNARGFSERAPYIFSRAIFSLPSAMRFDLIVSNPPYIDPDMKGKLQREIGFEPEAALFADGHGTAVVRKIIDEGGFYLAGGGQLLIEIGSTMDEFVAGHGAGAGFSVSIIRDYAGLPRVARLETRR